MSGRLVLIRQVGSVLNRQTRRFFLARGAGVGPAGLSAYQQALIADPPFVGTEAEWLLSLDGADGVAPTAANIGAVLAGAGAKATLVDADRIGVSNSAAGGILVGWSYANLKAQILAWLTTAYRAILGQYDARTELVATNGSTKTLNFLLGNSFKIDASAMAPGESFTIALSNLPAGRADPAWRILLVTGANLPTVAWPNQDTKIADPVIEVSSKNEVVGRTYDNGTTNVHTLGQVLT